MDARDTPDDDFVKVASGANPTEAHLLRGVLQSAGLQAVIADEHFVNADPWMSVAVGGVRVLVPQSQAEQAAQVLASYRAGTYALEDEDGAPAPASHRTPTAPLYSPDRAVLLSFALTPVFGAAVQLANAHLLKVAPRRLRDLVWLAIMLATTLGVLYVLLGTGRGGLLLFPRASLAMGAVTLLWYFMAGQDQSRFALQAYGAAFPRRRLLPLVVPVAAGQLAMGWILATLIGD